MNMKTGKITKRKANIKLKKNQHLQGLLKFVVKDHWKYFRKTEESKTIEDLFEKLRIQMIEDKTYQEEEFKNKAHNDSDFAELVDLIREVHFLGENTHA